jgi:hypothetical protein
MNLIKGWCLIYTKSCYEKENVQKLIEEDFKTYLPLSITISQLSVYEKKVEKSFFISFVYLETVKSILKAYCKRSRITHQIWWQIS